MCGRFSALSETEAVRIADALGRSAPILELLGLTDLASSLEVFPGDSAPVLLNPNGAAPEGVDAPTVSILNWGFILPDTQKLIFNTRVENATTSPLWRRAYAFGRCLVPARAFCETHRTETVQTDNGKRRKQVVRFRGDVPVVLMAGIQQGGRFSVMTCEPDEQVSPVHTRMPLLLSPSSAKDWLAGADPRECRAFCKLSATPLYQRKEPPTEQLQLF